VISNLQTRVLQRPLDDRPVQLEVSVTVSDPERVVGGTASLRQLRLPEETCAAPGTSPVVATTPIAPENLEGDRLRVVLQARLPAGKSRLCFFVVLPEGLAQASRGLAEVPVNQTNELEIILDVSQAKPAPTPQEPPAVVRVTATDASAAESPLDTGTFQVSRTGSTSKPLAVSFSTDGTATSGSDYLELGSFVVIPAGSATATISLTPVNDGVGEIPETVVLRLSPGDGYTVGVPRSATVRITSEDPIVRIVGTTPSSGPEGDVTCEAGATPGSCPHACIPPGFDGTKYRIAVARSGSTAAELNVTLALGGTATPAPTDYYVRPHVSLGGNLQQLTIPAGAAGALFCIITIAGTETDAVAAETVTVTIQPASGYTVGSPSSTTVTINDDD
jgi:hypothetical protein